MIKNDKDIRVKKTERAIYQAFDKLLKLKDVEDISVTELAREAEINKGTFYLHYKDIYDLYNKYLRDSIRRFLDEVDFYDLLFEDPRTFISRLIMYFKIRRIEFPELQRSSQSPMIFVELMKEEIYSTNRVEMTPENDVKIEFIVYATIGLALSHGENEENYAIISDVAAKAIESFFSSIYE